MKAAKKGLIPATVHFMRRVADQDGWMMAAPTPICRCEHRKPAATDPTVCQNCHGAIPSDGERERATINVGHKMRRIIASTINSAKAAKDGMITDVRFSNHQNDGAAFFPS